MPVRLPPFGVALVSHNSAGEISATTTAGIGSDAIRARRTSASVRPTPSAVATNTTGRTQYERRQSP